MLPHRARRDRCPSAHFSNASRQPRAVARSARQPARSTRATSQRRSGTCRIRVLDSPGIFGQKPLSASGSTRSTAARDPAVPRSSRNLVDPSNAVAGAGSAMGANLGVRLRRPHRPELLASASWTRVSNAVAPCREPRDRPPKSEKPTSRPSSRWRSRVASRAPRGHSESNPPRRREKHHQALHHRNFPEPDSALGCGGILGAASGRHRSRSTCGRVFRLTTAMRCGAVPGRAAFSTRTATSSISRSVSGACRIAMAPARTVRCCRGN